MERWDPRQDCVEYGPRQLKLPTDVDHTVTLFESHCCQSLPSHSPASLACNKCCRLGSSWCCSSSSCCCCCSCLVLYTCCSSCCCALQQQHHPGYQIKRVSFSSWLQRASAASPRPPVELHPACEVPHGAWEAGCGCAWGESPLLGRKMNPG